MLSAFEAVDLRSILRNSRPKLDLRPGSRAGGRGDGKSNGNKQRKDYFAEPNAKKVKFSDEP